jgi:16S rRNA (uracil1498-N3)-methyltransferase
LPAGEAHHARDVLRLDERTPIELFDDAGQVARGELLFDSGRGACVAVQEIEPRDANVFHLTIAAAIPKGERADWMIEKLSELGVARFIPLATQRSVVLPGGTNKLQRWERIAIEAAKQSHRDGLMRIDKLQPLAEATVSPPQRSAPPAWYLSTEPGAAPISAMLQSFTAAELRLFIGPEGGWTDAERTAFDAAGLTAVRLTDTILRIETAAVAAAAVVMCILDNR